MKWDERDSILVLRAQDFLRAVSVLRAKKERKQTFGQDRRDSMPV